MLRSTLWMVGVGLLVSGCVGSHSDEDRPHMLTPNDLIVVGSLIPGEDCVVDPAHSTYLLSGRYDVLESGACSAPYTMNLQVESYLIATPNNGDGPDANQVQVTSARVSLFDVDDQLIDTGDLDNPFVVTTYATIPPSGSTGLGSGVVLVEAIPNAYRAHLQSLGEGRGAVFASIELTATSVSGSSAELLPFHFPIQLCVGCYSVCSSTLSDDALQALTVGPCNDNAGADGRVCIDSSC